MNKFFFIKTGIALAITTLIVAFLIIVLRISQFNVPFWYYYVLMLFSIVSAVFALFSIFPLRKQSISTDHLQANNVVSGLMLTRDDLDLEEKRLELAERSLHLEKERANYTLEMAHKLTHTLPSEADKQTREKLPEDVIKQLIQLQQIIRLQQIEDRRLSLEALIEQLIQLQQIENPGISQSEEQGNKEAVPEE